MDSRRSGAPGARHGCSATAYATNVREPYWSAPCHATSGLRPPNRPTPPPRSTTLLQRQLQLAHSRIDPGDLALGHRPEIRSASELGPDSEAQISSLNGLRSTARKSRQPHRSVAALRARLTYRGPLSSDDTASASPESAVHRSRHREIGQHQVEWHEPRLESAAGQTRRRRLLPLKLFSLEPATNQSTQRRLVDLTTSTLASRQSGP